MSQNFIRPDFKVLLSSNKANKYNLKMVVIEAYIDRKTRVFLSTNIHVEERLWNSEKQEVSNKHPLALQYNSILKKMISDLENYTTELYLKSKPITAELIRQFVNKTKINTFNDFYSQELERERTRIENSTFQTQFNTLTKLNLFNDNISFENLNVKLIYEWDVFLRKDNISEVTLPKFHAHIKKYINRAISYKIMNYADNPYLQFKVNRVMGKRDFLTIEELKAIENKKIPVKEAEKAKDVFIFCCYTGLAFSDAMELRSEHLTEHLGQLWIIKNRFKTGIELNVPLLPKSLEIIKKYAGYEKVLPQFTNAGINLLLKDIAEACGITKNLTTHVARHTFATTLTTVSSPIKVLALVN